MKKIPSLFKRNYEGNRGVYNEVVDGSGFTLAQKDNVIKFKKGDFISLCKEES